MMLTHRRPEQVGLVGKRLEVAARSGRGCALAALVGWKQRAAVQAGRVSAPRALSLSNHRPTDPAAPPDSEFFSAAGAMAVAGAATAKFESC